MEGSLLAAEGVISRLWWENLPCFHATPSRLANSRLLDVT